MTMIESFRNVALSSCFLLVCAAGASAQSKGVVLAGNNAVIDQEGQGRDFILGGNHNQVHIRGEANLVEITGNQNTVYLDRVDQVTVSGAQNKIYYQGGVTKGVPSISQFGVQNRIAKTGGQDSANTGKTRNVPEQPSATPNQPEAKSGPESEKVVLTGDGYSFDRTVNAKQVALQGDSNRVTLSGSIEQLVVTGDHNEIIVEEVKSVQFVGDYNHVVYRSTPGGQKPEVASVGDNNSVSPATP
jgi:hypothetical protein